MQTETSETTEAEPILMNVTLEDTVDLAAPEPLPACDQVDLSAKRVLVIGDNQLSHAVCDTLSAMGLPREKQKRGAFCSIPKPLGFDIFRLSPDAIICCDGAFSEQASAWAVEYSIPLVVALAAPPKTQIVALEKPADQSEADFASAMISHAG